MEMEKIMKKTKNMKKILVLHGVNLNMFGKRDPAQYGTITLAEINSKLVEMGKELGCQVETFQTNFEGEICDKIHQAHINKTDAVLINAGAWTHYSYGMRDALAILKIPIVEVHMSNIHAREEFRHFSVIAPLAKGQIAGFGLQSYLLGLRAAVDLLQEA
jgi:3-dehydroquinate dehydratase-2